MKDITGIVVSHNSRSLLKEAYESLRRFHPDMQMIIIDGSDERDPCRDYVKSLASNLTTIGLSHYNIGHGRGMDTAIRMCKTPLALIFDSDIVMVKSPVQAMIEMIEDDTYAVGYMEKTGFDGFEYGAHPHHKSQGFMWMMHPFFHLLQIKSYYKFHRYVHHGAPCFKAALDIHRQGLTDKICKRFPGLGHTGGKGWNWKPIPPVWVIHNTAGTRKLRRMKGLQEIEQGWER